MTTRVITLLREYVIVDVRNNNVNFHWKYVHFKSDKNLFKKSYDKTNLTLVVISYEMTTRVRSSTNDLLKRM